MAATDRSRSSAAILATLAVADVAFAFQQTGVIPAVPTIQADLHASQSWSAWLVSGYLAASVIATPLLGKLGDRVGKRRMLSVALGIFLLGSIGAALSQSIAMLIAFRALQGAGGAVFPLSISIVREHLPEESAARGIALLTGAFGVGTTLGFVGSGAIVEALSWRWTFVAGAIGIGVASLLVPLIPRSRVHNRSGLDLSGAGLLTGGLVLVLVALTEGVPLGWGSTPVIGAFVVGAALLGGWVWHDFRTDEPLIELDVLSSRPVLLTNLATFALGYVLFGLYFLIPYLVEGKGPYGFGVSALGAGLYLLPSAIAQIAGGLASDRLAERTSPKAAFTLGMTLAAAAAAWLALLHDRPWEVLVGMALLGLGAGLGIAVASALITATAPSDETSIATALNSVVRRVGGGFGGQIAAALLAGVTLASSGRPAEAAFAIAFWICAALALAGAAFALRIRTAAAPA